MSGAQKQDSPLTFIAATDMEANRLVKFTAARTVGYAGSGDENKVVGTTLEKVTAGEPVAVDLISGDRTFIVVASAAIAVNAQVNCAANGKVVTTSTQTRRIGKAIQAASGDLSEVEAILGYVIADGVADGSA